MKKQLPTAATDEAAPAFLEELVRRAERARASDIHLQMIGKAANASLRLDGMMSPPIDVPESVAERLFGRIKFLSRLKTYQDSLPQDGRIDRAEVGAGNDIRVATYPTVTGEKIVLRFFTETEQTKLDDLQFPAEAMSELTRFLSGNAGLLLLTGPAGSGKTTTIYACLRRLSEMGGRHIITIEDPVEQTLRGIMQTEISEARGLTFATAARHLLRQDPQVLVVGEVRDEETANVVVRAAMTGHLVITTLHAGSCTAVVERLQMMCADKYAAISSLELILNQRLLRRVCADCHGARCDACLQTGYHGRVAVLEWLRLDAAQREQVRTKGSGALEVKHSIRDAARELVKAGVTNAEEFERVFSR